MRNIKYSIYAYIEQYNTEIRFTYSHKKVTMKYKIKIRISKDP